MAIFISYSHKDKEFVDELATDLVANGVRVWVDTWELNVGEPLISRMQKAIQEADALLIVLSKASVQSEWCKKELSSGLIRELEEKRVVVLPLLVEECEIPFFLRDKMHADFTIDKDKGLHQVLDAIAKVTSDSLRRIDHEKYFVDFGLYSIIDSGSLKIRLTFLEQAVESRYSVITEIIIIGNETATQRYLKFAEEKLEWFERHVILEMLDSVVLDENCGKLMITSSIPQTQHIEIQDKTTPIMYQVEIESRRIGEDNGKDVLVDWGNQLHDFVGLFRKEALRFPQDAKNKIAKIIKQVFH